MAKKFKITQHRNSTDPQLPFAPVIYFEGVPKCGSRNGLIDVTLVTYRHAIEGGELRREVIVVGHLRCNEQVALELRGALEQALLKGAAVPDRVN